MVSRHSSSSPIPLEEPNSNKQWICNECKYTFSQSKLLETHAAETDHKAYRCTKEKACDKVFTLRPSLIRHERSHSAQKAHACSRCQKKFHRKDNCHDHERTCGRVARRARQSASTSPATSATTRSATTIDASKAAVDPENLRHTAEPAHEDLRSLNTSGAPHQKYNGHDDEMAIPPVISGLRVPPKSPPTSADAYFSSTKTTPTQSRTSVLNEGTLSHPPEAEHDTLLFSSIPDDHTTSRSATSQPYRYNEWSNWYHTSQSQDVAPSLDLECAEDDRYYNSLLDSYASDSMGMPLDLLYRYSGPSTTSDSYDDDYYYYDSGLLGNNYVPTAPLLPYVGTALLGRIGRIGKGRTCNKIAIFFSLVKAFFKAAFRRYQR